MMMLIKIITIQSLIMSTLPFSIINKHNNKPFLTNVKRPNLNSIRMSMSTANETSISAPTMTSDEELQTLLNEVTLTQLQTLSKQYSLATEDKTKEELFEILQNHAKSMIQKTKERRIVRLEEQGVSYSEEEYPEIDGNVYYAVPGNETSKSKTDNSTTSSNKDGDFPKNVPEPNEQGERVVTVYSTTDNNDLTGGAANDPNMPNNPIGSTDQKKDNNSFEEKSNKSAEFQNHVELCNDFLLTILADTGLPAFQMLDSAAVSVAPKAYTPFDPKKHISTPMLNKITKSLLYENGESFHTAVQEIELNSIASDGMNNIDDVTKGGGHYKTVLQLKTFLEGFRSAEARRKSRELIQMMLESLVRNGVNELDMVLDKSLEEGILNDELLGFLNEMIVKQERRIRNAGMKKELEVMDVSQVEEEEHVNVTMIKGEYVETIDLQAFSQEYNDTAMPYVIQDSKPKQTGPEQLLVLLKSIRERLKVEAAYRTDIERGQCLKTLSYCLRTKSQNEREALIWNAFGKGLEQLEEFCELVNSSMEYVESTSYQLMPGNKQGISLDGKELKRIYDLAMELKKKQVVKANSGTWR